MRLHYTPQVLQDILLYEGTFLAVTSLKYLPLIEVSPDQEYLITPVIHVGTKQNADNIQALSRVNELRGEVK